MVRPVWGKVSLKLSQGEQTSHERLRGGTALQSERGVTCPSIKLLFFLAVLIGFVQQTAALLRHHDALFSQETSGFPFIIKSPYDASQFGEQTPYDLIL